MFWLGLARFGTILGTFFDLAERCNRPMLLIMRYLHASCRRHGGGQRDIRSSWARGGGQMPGFGGSFAGEPEALGQNRVAVPVGP